MHELNISALMPEPQGSGEASEESGVNIKNSENSPAIAQGSTSLEPLVGELLGDAPGAEDKAPQQFGPCVLQALIHACSTPRSIDIQKI
jgi:hypothetical protein